VCTAPHCVRTTALQVCTDESAPHQAECMSPSHEHTHQHRYNGTTARTPPKLAELTNRQHSTPLAHARNTLAHNSRHSRILRQPAARASPVDGRLLPPLPPTPSIGEGPAEPSTRHRVRALARMRRMSGQQQGEAAAGGFGPATGSGRQQQAAATGSGRHTATHRGTQGQANTRSAAALSLLLCCWSSVCGRRAWRSMLLSDSALHWCPSAAALEAQTPRPQTFRQCRTYLGRAKAPGSPARGAQTSHRETALLLSRAPAPRGNRSPCCCPAPSLSAGPASQDPRHTLVWPTR
jgi:hypothetical protein